MSNLCLDCGKDHGIAGTVPGYESGRRLIAIVPPKCGTNLLLQYLHSPVHVRSYIGMIWKKDKPVNRNAVICQLKRFPIYAFAHLAHLPEYVEALNEHPTKIIFMTRDPRDQIISQYHWVKRFVDKDMSEVQFQNGIELIESEDPYLELIKAWDYRMSFFTPWLYEEGILRLTFEGLIKKPGEYLKKIRKFVQGTNAEGQIGGIAEMMGRNKPENSYTFREGKAGGWKEVFKPHHNQLFNELCADLMNEWGYEI